MKLAAAGALLGTMLVAQSREGTTPTALATDVGFVRVAHLSPDTAPFDAYVVPAGRAAAAITLRNRSYGQVSAYQPLNPGGYTVTLRGAGTGERGSWRSAPGGAPRSAAPITSGCSMIAAG